MAIEYIASQGGQNYTIYLTLRSGSTLVTGKASADVSLCQYYRPLAAAPVGITLSDLTNPDDNHTDGGFLEINPTNWPGFYRLDLPDAAVARGENFVFLTLKGASFDQIYGKVELDAYPSVVEGAVNDTTPGAAAFITDLPGGQDNLYNDAFLLFTSGSNTGVARLVTGWTNSSKTLTVNTLPVAPADGDHFIIVNR